MDNLKLPAYPQPIVTDEEGRIRSTVDYDWDYSGFNKIEKAALIIVQGMCSAGDWLQVAGQSQYKHISEVAVNLARAVIEEANK